MSGIGALVVGCLIVAAVIAATIWIVIHDDPGRRPPTDDYDTRRPPL